MRMCCVSDKIPQAALMKSLSWRWRDCLWNELLIGGAAAWCSMQANYSIEGAGVTGGRLDLLSGLAEQREPDKYTSHQGQIGIMWEGFKSKPFHSKSITNHY